MALFGRPMIGGAGAAPAASSRRWRRRRGLAAARAIAGAGADAVAARGRGGEVHDPGRRRRGARGADRGARQRADRRTSGSRAKGSAPSATSASQSFRGDRMTVMDLPDRGGRCRRAPARPLRRCLIDGAWRAAPTGATFDAPEPRPTASLVTACRRAAPPRPRPRSPPRGGPSMTDAGRGCPGKERGRAPARVADLIDRDRETDRPGRDAGGRQADHPGAGRDRGRRRALALCRRRWRATLHGDSRNSLGAATCSAVVLKRADRRRRDHHALELPVPDRQPEAALRAGGRLHRGGEALGDDPGLDRASRRDAGRGRPAGGRGQHRRRLRPAGRRALVTPPARRHGVLHRLDRGRQGHRRGRRADAEEGRAGARRQESAGDLPRRRSRRGGRCHRLRRLLQRRRMLQLRQPMHRPAGHRRGVVAERGGAVAKIAFGDPARSGDQGRRHHLAEHLAKIDGYVGGASAEGASVRCGGRRSPADAASS